MSIVWIAFTTIFSWDVIVSLKHLIARLFFVIPCYFLMIIVFKDYKKCFGLSLPMDLPLALSSLSALSNMQLQGLTTTLQTI